MAGVTVPTSDSTGFIMIAKLYGKPGASVDKTDYNTNEKLIAAAIKRAWKFRDRQSFLGGDFNINPEDSKMLTMAVRMEWLFDVSAEWIPQGQQLQNTFSRHVVKPNMKGSGTTRIDAIFANFCARHTIVDFRHRFDLAEGYDHVPLQITIGVDTFHQQVRILRKPSTIDLSTYDH